MECSEGVCGVECSWEECGGWSADMYMDFEQVQLYAPVHNPSHVPLL